jgi:hypothetical protein
MWVWGKGLGGGCCYCFLLWLFFREGLMVFAQAGLDSNLPTYTSCTAGMTGSTTTPVFLIEIESH